MDTEKHRPKRRNLLAETRMLAEYLAAYYPGEEWRIKQRLGASAGVVDPTTLDVAEANLLRNYNRFADAVIVRPTEIVVLEAAMWDAVNKVGQVKQYMLLVPFTPDMADFLDRPIVGEIVTAQHDPLAEEVIRDSGLRYVHFEPEWIEEYYALYPHRRRRAAHSGLPRQSGAVG